MSCTLKKKAVSAIPAGLKCETRYRCCYQSQDVTMRQIQLHYYFCYVCDASTIMSLTVADDPLRCLLRFSGVVARMSVTSSDVRDQGFLVLVPLTFFQWSQSRSRFWSRQLFSVVPVPVPVTFSVVPIPVPVTFSVVPVPVPVFFYIH